MRNTNLLSLPHSPEGHFKSGEDFQLQQTVWGLFAVNFLLGFLFVFCFFFFPLHLKNRHSRARAQDLVSHETQERKMQVFFLNAH